MKQDAEQQQNTLSEKPSVHHFLHCQLHLHPLSHTPQPQESLLAHPAPLQEVPFFSHSLKEHLVSLCPSPIPPDTDGGAVGLFRA